MILDIVLFDHFNARAGRTIITAPFFDLLVPHLKHEVGPEVALVRREHEEHEPEEHHREDAVGEVRTGELARWVGREWVRGKC